MSTQSKNKITLFKEDRRLLYLSAIRSVCAAGIIATIVFSLFAYRDDLNIANIKRIISYMEHMSFKGSPTDTFEFETGLETVCIPFDVGLATCSGGSFRFIPPFEGSDFSYQIKYSAPYMRASSDSVFVYDLGGTGISCLNSYSLKSRITLESKIISFTCNLSSQSAVITDEAGYRTALTVFDKKLNEVYKWQTSEHFAFLPALSPNGKTAAVCCVGQREGSPYFYIKYLPTDGSEPSVTIDLGESRVYSIEYMPGGDLSVLCGSGFYIYDDKGGLVNGFAFSDGSLNSFRCDLENGLTAISLKGEMGDSSRIVVINDEAEAVYDGNFSGDVRYLDISNGVLALLSGKEVCRIDLEGGECLKKELSGVRDIVITGDGRVTAVYNDFAQTVEFDQGDENE